MYISFLRKYLSFPVYFMWPMHSVGEIVLAWFVKKAKMSEA